MSVSLAANASGSESAVAASSSLTARCAIESRTSQPSAGRGGSTTGVVEPRDDDVEVGLFGGQIGEQTRVVDHARKRTLP